MDLETLRNRRRGALITECVCFTVALLSPVLGAYLLWDRLEALAAVPVSIWVPLIPPLLLFLAGIGFHRHRKGIERQLREATTSQPGPR